MGHTNGSYKPYTVAYQQRKAKRATYRHPEICYSDFRRPQASRHWVWSLRNHLSNFVPADQCHAVSVSRLHFPETHATPHNFRRQPGPYSENSDSLMLPRIMDRACFHDVSPACCESFCPSLYLLCLGSSLTQFQVRSEPLGLPQAVPWRESESGLHFPRQVPSRTTFPRNVRELKAAPSFACGTLVVRGRKSAR